MNWQNKINQIKKDFATPESKIKTSKDVIKRTKELKQWVDNGFRSPNVKEKEVPFYTKSELEQKILEGRREEFKKVFSNK